MQARAQFFFCPEAAAVRTGYSRDLLLVLPPEAHPTAPAASPSRSPRRSSDSRFNSGLQTLRVEDRRALTGDSTSAPRWIASLPFSDSDVSSRFGDKYPVPAGEAAGGVSCRGKGPESCHACSRQTSRQGCQQTSRAAGAWPDFPAGMHPAAPPPCTAARPPRRRTLPARRLPPPQGAPDVVYAYTAPADVAVELSTCGSLYDTRLLVFDDPANPQARRRGGWPAVRTHAGAW